MSSNTIHITASDNELYVLAYQWGASYQLAHIQSGNGNAVNVTVNINQGAYTEPAVQNGVNGPLNSTYSVNLPSGDYELVAVGVNWGGPWSFALNVNGGAQRPAAALRAMAWCGSPRARARRAPAFPSPCSRVGRRLKPSTSAPIRPSPRG